MLFTEVTNVEIILDKDLVSELPKKSIDDRVNRFGHKTGTFPTTAYAVVQTATTEWSNWSPWLPVQRLTEIMQPQC